MHPALSFIFSLSADGLLGVGVRERRHCFVRATNLDTPQAYCDQAIHSPLVCLEHKIACNIHPAYKLWVD
jgi:hypothetical protein